MRRRGRAAAMTILGAAALAALAGCGGGSTAAPAKGQTLSVELTDAGCAPAGMKATSGPVTFVVSNGGSDKVTELELKNLQGIIVGERENIVGGITGSFTLDLQPGRYILNCPNGDVENNGSLLVTGSRLPPGSSPSRCSRRPRPATRSGCSSACWRRAAIGRAIVRGMRLGGR